tara:strand:+ start:356 stop:1855 length:1500 start_codon:yes stop_codon:yes gene_type:complete
MMAKEKGGMVLIIGMGGKPKKGKKDSVKKAVREPRQRGGGGASDRARLHSFKQKMRADPEHLDRVLGSLGIERKLLERVVEGKHGKRLDSAMEDDSVNMPEMIDEARKLNAANKGQFTQSGDAKPKLKALLERKGISLNEFKRSMTVNPTMDFQERLNSLSPEKENKSREGPNTRKNRGKKEEGSPEAPSEYSEMPDDMFHGEEDEESRYTGGNHDPTPGSDEEDKLLDFYTRLYSHKPNPEEAAMMHLRPQGEDSSRKYNRAGPDMTPSTEFTQANAPPGTHLGSPDEDEDPSIGFDAASIGATTPKGDTANPRLLNDPKSSRAGQGEERTISQFLQTSFDNPNVMDAAWALLKGNPSMRDAEGRAINHPAAMVYDDLAAQIHLNEQNPFDERAGNPDDESVADIIESMRRGPGERFNEIGQKLYDAGNKTKSPKKEAIRATKDDRNELDKYRQEARNQTANTMEFGNEDNAPGPNYGIEQSTGTDVRMKPGNIMEQM